MSSLDPKSKFVNNGSNFMCDSDNIRKLDKLEADLNNIPYQSVINTYVTNENFVWYLYNFLEKTENIGINVDQLVLNLITKGGGTPAYDFMLTHFINSYNIHTTNIDDEYCNNSAIEYFYFLLLDNDTTFKTIANTIQKNWINIEYDDFYSSEILIKKLQGLTNFDQSHFLKQHKQLIKTNLRYLSKKKDFYTKFKNRSADTEFDILEWAYIGWLLSKESKERLDWFNKDVRLNKINELDVFYV